MEDKPSTFSGTHLGREKEREGGRKKWGKAIAIKMNLRNTQMFIFYMDYISNKSFITVEINWYLPGV